MKCIKLTITLAIGIFLIQFVRQGESFHVARCLPFCDGEITLYDYGALACILIFIFGMGQMNRDDEDD